MSATALAGLPRQIKHAVRQVRGRRDLVVVVSSRPRFELGSVDLQHTTLDLADLDRSYYLRGAGRTARSLAGFIQENSFQRVCFIGASKGGFGALMLSRELAEALPRVQFSAIAFSPQTRLWPKNEGLGFPSYAALIAEAKHNRRLAASLERFGDQRRPLASDSVRWRVYYGSKNAGDTAEAEGLPTGGVTLAPLPMSSHSTLLPVLCSRLEPEQIRRIVQAHHGAKSADADLAFNLLSSNQEQLVNEIAATQPVPSFNEIVSEAFDAMPGPNPWRRLMARFARA
ncbi:hypothetical protein IHQ68_02495 [Chelatococcus sambhunathii]|uniref:Alpha/beta hydrolase family n=1 Tax=Chelatococcus sambhunathii TaxID=363953 RepID=A0ABU1DBP1_9HYPH|nr:hypothetical protein [Chelatococcus sambhunathii]MDR4305492.1 hypothetical protein [Chelatococcus sambhunathii]